MNLFQELRQRRVPQITSAYIVGGWGLIQFLDFLEGRMTVSPNLVNLIGIGLFLLLPSVVIMAWVHGRPGRDTWGRIPKVMIPANLLALVLMLLFLFRGQEMGTVTQMIAVEDENGTISERVVPKSHFRRRVLVFYPENIGNPENNWARETLNQLQAMDLNQDVFIDPLTPLNLVDALKDAGSEDGHNLSRSLQRKMANDLHLKYFLTSTIRQENGLWIFASELHEVDTGRVLATRTTESDNLYALADLTSRQIREDLGIQSSHLDESPDFPVKELTSSDMEAVKSYSKGMTTIILENDWAKGAPLFDDAVERDPGFAVAQFLRFAVYQTLGDTETATEAMAAAMDNLYRVPERTSFMIKSSYYYNIKEDADKSLAVVKMWSQIYPNDIEAFNLMGLYYTIRQDLPNAIIAYERILEIDPSQVKLIRKVASLHRQLGNTEEAEKFFVRFVEMFPTNAEGYRDLAGLYSSSGQLAKARETLEKAQLVDPGELDITLGLIGIDIKYGKFEHAARALDSELGKAKTGRDQSNILLKKINLSEDLGHADQLIVDLKLYYKTTREIQNPMQVDFIYSMILPKIILVGQPELALEMLDDLAAQIPPPYDKLLGVSRAWAMIELDRTEEARTTLVEATEMVDRFQFEGFRPLLALVGGLIAEKDGDIEDAVLLYRKAVGPTMESGQIFKVNLVRGLRKTGQLEEAAKILDRALKINPSNPELHLEKAILLKLDGQMEPANEHLSKAMKAWESANKDFPLALRAQALLGEIN